ncbi:MAG TPA: hypothetical protein VFO55_04225 [Gemmatimonadaceae bacterium]|nr:hypothetical protein [Gemmatimonadaceae bacterium]
MRIFRDTAGTEWTVFEVRRTSDETNWAYLPRGFRSGWLCFESAAGKRRLSPVPEGWKLLDAPDLEAMLQRATAVERARTSSARDGLDVDARKGPDNDANPRGRAS